MVATRDLKSLGRKAVRVRVPPAVLVRNVSESISFSEAAHAMRGAVFYIDFAA